MIHDSLEQIIAGLQEALADADKFDKGNTSAGRRARKAAQEARSALFDLRKKVSEIANSR